MSRYVDANGLKQTFCAECSHSIKCEDCDIEYHFEHFPTADVVKVVRCKDCKRGYWHTTPMGKTYMCCDLIGKATEEDWFCADGERREDAEAVNTKN